MPGNDKGFLPCFHLHQDSAFPLDNFYENTAFINKVEAFLSAILTSANLAELGNKISARGGIQVIDPHGNRPDRELCQRLGWQKGKVYRIDYGDNPYRLLFGLDSQARRCYILALDALHTTRPTKR